ncbi:hypothetical protein PZA11_002455 [Diplocarpon coronariae]
MPLAHISQGMTDATIEVHLLSNKIRQQSLSLLELSTISPVAMTPSRLYGLDKIKKDWTEQSHGKPRVSNPPYVPLPPPTSSHVCITPLIPGSVDLIALAGLAGFITSDSSSPKTIKDQAPIANSKIKSCLTAAGATPRDMVQMKHYTARETGDPEQDELDVVRCGWGEC